MIEVTTALIDVITADLGEPPRRGRQPFWHCPFHDDRNPSFTIMPDGRRCKCFGCDFRGDAIDYVKARYNLSHKDAVSFLGGSTGFSLPAAPQRSSHRRKPPEPSAEQLCFAKHASKIVSDCVDRLHSPQGARAFRWLRLRGLRPEVIRLARLGYNPKVRYPHGIRLERGITIPWMDGERIQAIKVRLPGKGQKDKYRWVKGQNLSGLYFPQPFLAGRPTLLTEGEFDALLGFQELSNFVNVGTLGSASASPDDRALEQLLGSAVIFVCYDADAAGREGDRRWHQVTRRVRSLQLPAAMDLTDLYRVNVDLRAWLAQQLQHTTHFATLHPTLWFNHLNGNGISVGNGTLHLPYTSSSGGQDHASNRTGCD